jgi:hypothetical protein
LRSKALIVFYITLRTKIPYALPENTILMPSLGRHPGCQGPEFNPQHHKKKKKRKEILGRLGASHLAADAEGPRVKSLEPAGQSYKGPVSKQKVMARVLACNGFGGGVFYVSSNSPCAISLFSYLF